MRIYTKAGDDGTTGLFLGGRVSKGDVLVDACGDIDEAVSLLGVARAACPDGRLADHVPQVVETLTGLLTEGSWLVAPWRRDAHPDHEAAGHAAATAASTHICLLEYPVWLWHWAEPRDERVPWAQLRAFRLSPDERQRKVEAMSAHVSQVLPLSHQQGDEALLAPGVLAYFERDIEVFFVGEGSIGEPG